MRLIDADALKNLSFERMIHTDFGDTAIPIEEIDNVPTVEVVTDEDIKNAYDTGYKMAKHERPQGEDNTPTGTWIPEEETYTDLSGTIETYTRFKCDHCMQGQNFGPYPFCPWCGKDMRPEAIREAEGCNIKICSTCREGRVDNNSETCYCNNEESEKAGQQTALYDTCSAWR